MIQLNLNVTRYSGYCGDNFQVVYETAKIKLPWQGIENAI